MKKITHKVLAPFFILLTVFFAGRTTFAGSGAEDAGFALRIAVVDVRKVMAGSEEWLQFHHERRAKGEEVERVLRGYENRLAVLEMQYEDLPPGTDRTLEKRHEYEALLEEFQQKREELTGRYQMFIVDGFRRFYASLGEVIAHYARENNIALVLKKQQIDLSISEMEGQQLVEELELFGAADVLYADPGLDISSEVVRLLNEGMTRED